VDATAAVATREDGTAPEPKSPRRWDSAVISQRNTPRNGLSNI